MNIYKAFLLTAILLAFDFGLNIGFSHLVESYFESNDSLETSDLLLQSIGAIGILFTLFSYFLVIKIFKIKFFGSNKTRNVSYIKISYLYNVYKNYNLFMSNSER